MSVSPVCVCVCLPEVSVFLRQDLSLNLETANYPMSLVTKEPQRTLWLPLHTSSYFTQTQGLLAASLSLLYKVYEMDTIPLPQMSGMPVHSFPVFGSNDFVS